MKRARVGFLGMSVFFLFILGCKDFWGGSPKDRGESEGSQKREITLPCKKDEDCKSNKCLGDLKVFRQERPEERMGETLGFRYFDQKDSVCVLSDILECPMKDDKVDFKKLEPMVPDMAKMIREGRANHFVCHIPQPMDI